MNVIEKLWDNLIGLAVRETTPLIEFSLSDPASGTAVKIKGGQHYFQLRVTDLQLKYSRAWFTEWFPAISSMVRLKYGGRESAAICRFSSPPKESLAPGVYKGYALTDLLPYNGGNVEFDIGLLGIKGDNALVLSLHLIEDFSDLVSVPLSSSFKAAEKLAGAFDRVLEKAAEKVHLRLHDSVSDTGATPFLPSYRVVILAPAGTVEQSDLVVVEGRLHRRRADGTSAPFAGYDYFLLRIEATEERSDFSCLPEIETAVQQALQAWREVRPDEETEKLRRAAIMAALTSPDLVEDDRTRVVAALQKKFAITRGPSGLDQRGPELNFAAFVRQEAPTLQEARLRGAFTLDEALEN